MGIYYIDGVRFSRSLLAGVRRLISQQEYLNKINVFPVPDNDTGTNMGFTVSSIEKSIEDNTEVHINRVADTVGELSIDNARGNSGVILAQFLTGFAEGVKEKQSVKVKEFVHALQVAKSHAYEALLEPKEGTILTVITDWIQSMQTASQSMHDFKKILGHGLEEAQRSLKRTTLQMSVLAKAKVVDAGAQGFIYLLEGIQDFIQTGKIQEVDQIEIPQITISEPITFNEKYRYCTECLISGENVDRNFIKTQLAELGDSIVVAGSKSKVKIHIHTDTPKTIVNICQKFGVVTDEKADDMLRQQHDAHGIHHDVAVIVDSGCDLPEEILKKYNIHMVPVRLNFGQDHYVDKITISSEEFWKELKSNPTHPQTSQPTPGDFLRKYQLLSSHYKKAISIHIPEKLSGTFQSASNAASQMNSFPISVIDSRNASIGIGLIAIQVAEAVENGMQYDKLLNQVETAIRNTKVFVGLTTLEYVVRGGRVPASKKKIADLLHINPILSLSDSGIKAVGKSFGKKNILPKFKKFVEKSIDWNKPCRIGIAHTNNEEVAQRWGEDFGRRIGDENIFISEVGPAVGVHSGPEGMVIAVQTLEESLHD